MHKDLESSGCCTIVHFVRFGTMALAAELRSLVAACGCACRVIRRANEEHGRIGAARQARVARNAAGRAAASECNTCGHLDHIHQVLVVAGGAKNDRLVVVGSGSNEEAVVSDELRRLRTVHQDLPEALMLQSQSYVPPQVITAFSPTGWSLR